MTRIAIIDDDQLVADSLKTILSAQDTIQVTGVGHSAEDAVRLYHRLRPDIMLMDIRMHGTSGIQAAHTIISRFPEAAILFLTTFSDDEYIIQALKMGAKGYLIKQNYDSIVPAINAVSLGHRVFGDSIAEKMPRLLQSGTPSGYADFGLSEKEFAIVRHVANGLSNKEISETVFLGEGTVRNYISSILEKLDLRDRTQLAIFYYKTFLIER